jgi:hypothetical protein
VRPDVSSAQCGAEEVGFEEDVAAVREPNVHVAGGLCDHGADEEPVGSGFDPKVWFGERTQGVSTAAQDLYRLSHAIGHEDPGSLGLQMALRQGIAPIGTDLRTVVGVGSRLAQDEFEWIGRRGKTTSLHVAESVNAQDGCLARKMVPDGFAVPGRGELARQKEGYGAARLRQFEGTFKECDREVGKVSVPAVTSGSPAGEPAPQPFPDAWCETLSAHPGRVADDQIEPTGSQNLRRVDLECEERETALRNVRTNAFEVDKVGLERLASDFLRRRERDTVAEEVGVVRKCVCFPEVVRTARNGLAERCLCQSRLAVAKLLHRGLRLRTPSREDSGSSLRHSAGEVR